MAVYYAVQGGADVWRCMNEIQSVTIQIKATEQYFPVVLFIVLWLKKIVVIAS